MRNIACLVGISTILLMIGCKKSPELLSNNIPIFIGNVETSVSLKKVVFSASFKNLNPDNAEACGFEWSKETQGQINVFYVGKISDDNFSAQLAVNLEEGATYQVRAWIIIGSRKFYSKYSYFFGIVALKPEIISLSRTYALWGDTIRIKARNITSDVIPSDVTVTIGVVNIEPFFVDTTEIDFIMPFSPTKGNLNITFMVKNYRATNFAVIENALPDITSVAPVLVHIDDLVTMKGKFRSEYADRIIPTRRFNWNNTLNYEVLSFTDNEILIRYSGEQVCDPYSTVSFNIYSHAGDQNYNTIQTGFYLTQYSHWSRLNSSTPYNMAKGVALGGKGYIIEMSNGWPPSPFWKYDPSTDHLTYLTDFPALIPEDGCMVVCNGEIYAGFLRTIYQTSDFYKYNLSESKWIECADLEYINGTITRTTATIENKIYVFMSGSNKRCVYNPDNNTWTVTSCTVPEFIESARMFVFNGDYYFYRGKYNNVVYKYVLSENEFYPVALEGLGNGRSTFFTLDNRYLWNSGCDVYEVNMADSKLEKKPAFSNFVDSYNAYGDNSFLFEIGNKAYFFSNQNFMESFTFDGR
jgi:hypothetical protein